jgi:UDP-glucose:glycoprotein glucosyltransferase
LNSRSTPGTYKFGIREGRGQEVYELESLGLNGWVGLPVDATGAEVSLYSFRGLTIFPRFNRLPGMEEADVLDTSLSFTTEVSNWFKTTCVPL